MANASVMGARGLEGWTWNRCRICVAKFPKYLFNAAVTGFCSCIGVDRASRGPVAEQSDCFDE